MAQGGSIRRRMYGPCGRCGYRRLVNGTGLLRHHKIVVDGPTFNSVCPGSGQNPGGCACGEADCWSCQIEGVTA